MQGKWPGCVHHHVSAIPGKRYLMRIYITHFFLLDGTSILPSCPSSAFCTKSVIFEVLTTKMAGRVAFGEKTKYLFRQRKETIMGIAIGGQNFHIFVKSSESIEIEEQRRSGWDRRSRVVCFCALLPVIVIPASARTYIHVFLPPLSSYDFDVK